MSQAEKLEAIVQDYKKNGTAQVPGSNGSSENNRAPSKTPTAATKDPPKTVITGMIKIGEQNIQRLVNDVILQLDPMLVEEEVPGIATHVLFMCLMYADHLRNAKMIQGILTRTMSGIKDVVMHNTTDMNMLAFWTSNTYRLLSNMKQFSGEKQFKVPGSLPQRSFKNFDLQQYRTVLADLLVCRPYCHWEHQPS